MYIYMYIIYIYIYISKYLSIYLSVILTNKPFANKMGNQQNTNLPFLH